MYYILFGILYLFSLLPLRVLYLLSDLAYFLLYKVAGYRKNVVLNNLTIAFSEKSDAEKEVIAAKFYRNFTDTFIETIKFISASPAFFRRHFEGDFSLVNEVHRTGRSMQIHVGHNFNWELMNLAVAPHAPGKLLGVYLPLNNKIFDRLFRYIRGRFATILIAANRMREEMLPHRGTQYILGLIADQSPPHADNAYWAMFFNRPTAFIKGPERYARRNNIPVVFGHFTKRRRGHYQLFLELGEMNPAELEEGQLTARYARFLETVMKVRPDMWLWSHRRWKHVWKPEYGPVAEVT